jgi:hypothetical protein
MLIALLDDTAQVVCKAERSEEREVQKQMAVWKRKVIHFETPRPRANVNN